MYAAHLLVVLIPVGVDTWRSGSRITRRWDGYGFLSPLKSTLGTAFAASDTG